MKSKDVLNDAQQLIMNMDLCDLDGEQWKEIPGLEGLAMISSYGRVKRLGYQLIDSRGRINVLKERIQKVKRHIYYNRFLKEQLYHLSTRIQINGINHYITIGRYVYYCFVEQFDLNDKSIIIVPKDHDGFNLNPGNLLRMDNASFQEHIRASNRRNPDFWKYNSIGIPFFSLGQQSHKKQVSRYDSEGNILETYESIDQAATGVRRGPAAISAALKDLTKLSAGYYWRLGAAPSTEILPVVRNRKAVHDVAYFPLRGDSNETE